VPTPPPTTDGKLSDLARHVVVPTGLVSTGWPAVRDKCLELGIRFDSWQDGAGRIILSKRADGLYATSVGGVVISIPRQVGKTFLLGAIVFALCLLFPGLTVIWTAHRLRTADETFASMQGMSRRKKIAPFVDKPKLGSGEQEIRFRNGSRILFGARERGFGRGFTLVDVLVFDEAQILTENAIDDMVPATNQAPNPLLLFTGTPPKPTDPGEVFSAKRDKALSGESDDMAYIEFSADEGANPDDKKQWARANPSYPTRTPATAVMRMRENLTVDSFLREALGIWSAKSTTVIPLADWFLCEDPASAPAGEPVFALDVSPNGMSASIAAAGRRADGLAHVEIIDKRDETGWLLERIPELKKTWKAKIVGDPYGPAGGVIRDLAKVGIEVEPVSGRDYAAACGLLYVLVTEHRMKHRPEPLLDAAIVGATRKNVGDGAFVWSRKSSTVDISPFVAVTLALAAVPDTAAPVSFSWS
jgi:phage terminase large subunit-like protein